MELQITYSNDLEQHTKDIYVEVDKQEDHDIVPYGEGQTNHYYTETQVFVYGDIPEEIKEDIRKTIIKGRKVDDGSTKNWTWWAE